MRAEQRNLKMSGKCHRLKYVCARIELALLNEFLFIWTKCCCVSFGPVVFNIILYTILNGAKTFQL